MSKARYSVFMADFTLKIYLDFVDGASFCNLNAFNHIRPGIVSFSCMREEVDVAHNEG